MCVRVFGVFVQELEVSEVLDQKEAFKRLRSRNPTLDPNVILDTVSHHNIALKLRRSFCLCTFPHNKMRSLIPIGVLVENDVKFHDNSMDFFHKNTIKMNHNL